MTIRRINHTGRTRIKQEHITIVVMEKSPRRSEFVAKLNLSRYDLPQEAAVFVEAYALSVCQRFSFGRIGNFSPPATLCLSEFDNVDALKFRVKVVQLTEGNKHILAEADKIIARRSDEDASRTPLLPVRASSELGQDVFRLDDTDAPVLLINSSVGDWKAVSTSPMFIALTYPSIVRQILSGILIQDKLHEWGVVELGSSIVNQSIILGPNLSSVDAVVCASSVASFVRERHTLFRDTAAVVRASEFVRGNDGKSAI